MIRLLGSFATFVIIGLLLIFSWQSYQQYRQPVALRFVITSWPTAQLVTAVSARNFFADRNLNVKLINVGDNYDAALRAIKNGEADGGILPLSDAIQLSLEGTPLRIVLGVDYSSGADGIVAVSDVKEVSDLKGRRVAYQKGSYGELLLRESLRRSGLTLEDVISVQKNPEEVAQSFLKGEVDAVSTLQPFLDQALRRSGSSLLFSSAALPGLIPDVMVFRKETIDHDRASITKFLTAWFNGIKQLNEGSQSRREIFAIVGVSTGRTIVDVERLFTTIKLFNFTDNAIAFTYANDLLSLYRSTEEYLDFRGGLDDTQRAQVVHDVIDPSFVRSGLRDSMTKTISCVTDESCL